MDWNKKTNSTLTSLQFPGVHAICPAAHSGTMTTEDKVIATPRVYAQSG